MSVLDIQKENFALFIRIIVLEALRQRDLGTPKDEIEKNILHKYMNGIKEMTSPTAKD